MTLIVILLAIIVIAILWPKVGKGCFIGLVALIVGLPILFFTSALAYDSGGWPWVFVEIGVLALITIVLAVRRQLKWERE